MAKKIVRRTRRGAYLHWVKALESGKYQQAQGRLCDTDYSGNPGYCCLGVLCELARKDGGREWGYYIVNSTTIDPADGVPPQEYVDFMGLTSIDLDILISMNDDQEKTFPEIAKYIRKKIMPKVLG